MYILDDFSELTNFVHSEFMKIRQTYGLKQMSEKDIKNISNTILKSFSYANSTTKKKLKYYAKVDWAIFTAPHCWLWRFLNRKLWMKCKEEMLRRETENKKEDVETKVLKSSGMPTHSPVDLDSLSLPSSVADAGHLLGEG